MQKSSGGQARFLEKVAAGAEKLASSLSSSSDGDEIDVDSDSEVKTPILENMKEAKRQMKKVCPVVCPTIGCLNNCKNWKAQYIYLNSVRTSTCTTHVMRT